MEVREFGLPRFAKAPVIEVALAVGFQPLPNFRITDFGLLWESAFKAEFPKVETQGPNQVAAEQFESGNFQEPMISLQLATAPPLPRVWFINEDDTALVQVQNNWFARNWRRMDRPVEYPHYDALRGPFVDDLRRFVDLVTAQELGVFRPTTCELSYFNQIELDGDDPLDLRSILNVMGGDEPAPLPFEPEAMGFAVQALVRGDDGTPRGRIYVKADPALRRSDLRRIQLLNITVKGPPESDDIDGVMAFLDSAHHIIVTTFDSMTAPRMHARWEKE